MSLRLVSGRGNGVLYRSDGSPAAMNRNPTRAATTSLISALVRAWTAACDNPHATRLTLHIQMQAKSTVFIAYYRVSTDKQGRPGLGLEAQGAAVAHYLGSVGGSLVAEFTEVETGKRNDRPELEELYSGIHHGGDERLGQNAVRLASANHAAAVDRAETAMRSPPLAPPPSQSLDFDR